MIGLFDDSIESDNSDYLALRDAPSLSGIKQYCNELWQTFSPFADRLFSDEFSRNIHQRFWEMYLGVQLLGLGFDLQPRSSDEGPDLHFIDGNRNVWIEAHVPQSQAERRRGRRTDDGETPIWSTLLVIHCPVYSNRAAPYSETVRTFIYGAVQVWGRG